MSETKTIPVPEGLHARLRDRAAERGMVLWRYVARLLEAALTAEDSSASDVPAHAHVAGDRE